MPKPKQPEKAEALSDDSARNSPVTEKKSKVGTQTERPTEFGGQTGPEPTRYGDWEKNGRCTDF